MANLNEVHLFNVATSGSSASTWLNNVLKAGGAISFHALRDNPFTQEVTNAARVDIPRLNELELFHGLKLLGQRIGNASGEPVAIGVTHSFYRSSNVLKAFEKLGGGRNIAMFRNPLSRINSQFQAHFNTYKVAKENDFNAFLLAHDNHFFKALEVFISEFSIAYKEASELFETLTKEIILSDTDNFFSCDQNNRLIFETMFNEVEKTKNILSELTQRDFFKVSDSYFKIKTNQHVQGDKNKLSLSSELPTFLLEILQSTIKSAPKSEEAYQELGYTKSMEL